MNKLRTCVQVLAIMAAAVTTYCLCQRDVTTGTMKLRGKSLWEAHVKCHEKYWKICP